MPYDDAGWSSFRRSLGWLVAIGIVATIVTTTANTKYAIWLPLGLTAMQGFMFAAFMFAFRDPVLVGWAILSKNTPYVQHKLTATVSALLWVALYALQQYSFSSGFWDRMTR